MSSYIFSFSGLFKDIILMFIGKYYLRAFVKFDNLSLLHLQITSRMSCANIQFLPLDYNVNF